MAGWIDVVFPSSVVASSIDRSFPPCVPVCSPVEEKTSVPSGVQMRTVLMPSSRICA